MFTFINNLLSKIKTPWRRYAVEIGAVIVLLFLLFAITAQTDSCGYSRSSKKYHAESAAWQTDRTKILARAEASEKRAAELEPKAIAFDALAEQHKVADAGLVKKIEEVSQNAANEEARAEQPTDCITRVQRVCDGLRANRINHDCGAITRESCGPR